MVIRSFIIATIYIILFRLIKSRRMRWARHVTHMEKIRNTQNFSLKNLNKRDHLEDLCADGRILKLIILEWIMSNRV
jgi:hypothetical protein